MSEALLPLWYTMIIIVGINVNSLYGPRCVAPL